MKNKFIYVLHKSPILFIIYFFLVILMLNPLLHKKSSITNEYKHITHFKNGEALVYSPNDKYDFLYKDTYKINGKLITISNSNNNTIVILSTCIFLLSIIIVFKTLSAKKHKVLAYINSKNIYIKYEDNMYRYYLNNTKIYSSMTIYNINDNFIEEIVEKEYR